MKIAHFVLVAACAISTSIFAQSNLDAIVETLQSRFPDNGKIDEISETPIPGLYEIRIGTDIAYTDASANYLLLGALIDSKTQKNLTEERREKLLVIDFAKLRPNDAIKIVRGDGSRTMAVFADPECGFCQQLEKDLLKIDNVTIYVYLYPILSSTSEHLARSTWCSSNKGDAWISLMTANKPPSAAGAIAKCDDGAIQRNLELGRALSIYSTPTLVFLDGRRVPGAIEPAEIESYLSSSKVKK